jgi:hypothetical protein
MPSEGPTVGEKGLEVADSATGARSKLGDFVTDLLAGPSHKAEPEPKKFNAAEYLTNPAARRELGEARAGAQVARENERAALDRMGESMAKGERLSASDLRNLTPATLLSIHSKGDDAVRTMIADNERYAKRDRDGGRERD